MAAMILARKPRKFPSLSSASSASVTLSRACASHRKDSERVAIHLTGAARHLGAKQHQRRFVVDGRLHAEAAADVAGDDADLVVGHLQHVLRQLGLEHMGALQGGVDGVAAFGRLVDADAAARLHGRCRHAIDDEVMLDDMRRLCECRVGRLLVALDLDEADVVRAILPHQRHAGLDGVAGRDDGRQRLVVDLDQFGSIDRLKIGLGNHEGDVVADHANAILDEAGIARPIARAAIAALEPAGHRQVAEAGGLVVGAGQHREHAGCGFGLRRVDRADARMGMRRAQHIAERHAGKRHVRDIAAAALEQPRVLEPRHRLTNREFTHCILTFRRDGRGGPAIHRGIGSHSIEMPGGGRAWRISGVRSYIDLGSPSIGPDSALLCAIAA